MQMAKRSLIPGGKLIINEVCLFTIKVALESLIAVFFIPYSLAPTGRKREPRNLLGISLHFLR